MDDSDYKKENKELKLQLLKYKQRIEIFEQKQHDYEQKMADLIQEVKNLQNIIKYYDNPNTSSSTNSLTLQRRNKINQQKRAERKQNREPSTKRGQVWTQGSLRTLRWIKPYSMI